MLLGGQESPGHKAGALDAQAAVPAKCRILVNLAQPVGVGQSRENLLVYDVCHTRRVRVFPGMPFLQGLSDESH